MQKRHEQMTSYHHFTALFLICLLLIKKVYDLSVNRKTNEKGKNGRLLAAEGTSSGRSSMGISPRPMLMGAARNALKAFNARVSLTCPVCPRPQAATPALRPGVDRSLPGGRSWRTGRMAQYRTECIRLPYTAPMASHRAFFVKVRGTAWKGEHAAPHSRINSD